MSGCLRDRTLLLLYEGEGTSACRAHLEACVACATRYQRLVHDLRVLRQVLREEPPAHAIPQPPLVFRLRWMAVASALAVILALVWVGVGVQRPSPPVIPSEARNEAVLVFLEEVSAALFSAVDASAAAILAPASQVAYLQAVLDGEWTCEGPEPFFTPLCDDHSFPFLEGEH